LAETPFGQYRVEEWHGGVLRVTLTGQVLASEAPNNKDEAKAAAQADYERRILSALSDAPVVTEEMVKRVFSAVIQCPHEIDHSSVTLRVDHTKQGGALEQLHHRIAAALGGGE